VTPDRTAAWLADRPARVAPSTAGHAVVTLPAAIQGTVPDRDGRWGLFGQRRFRLDDAMGGW
jgi:hypothetical protein